MKYKPLNISTLEAQLIVEILEKVLDDESYEAKHKFTGKAGAVFIKNIISKATKIAPPKPSKEMSDV